MFLLNIPKCAKTYLKIPRSIFPRWCSGQFVGLFRIKLLSPPFSRTVRTDWFQDAVGLGWPYVLALVVPAAFESVLTHLSPVARLTSIFITYGFQMTPSVTSQNGSGRKWRRAWGRTPTLQPLWKCCQPLWGPFLMEQVKSCLICNRSSLDRRSSILPCIKCFLQHVKCQAGIWLFQTFKEHFLNFWIFLILMGLQKWRWCFLNSAAYAVVCFWSSFHQLESHSGDFTLYGLLAVYFLFFPLQHMLF